jgi:hypothetical protein
MPPDQTTDTTSTVDTSVTTAPAAPATTEQPAATTEAPAATGTEQPATTEAPAAKTAEDWAAIRTRIANGDEKLEKRLARYTSVDSMAEALIAAQNKIASGGLKAPLAEDATPEQLAEWRAENGIPSAPEEYDTTLPDGLVIGAEDQPIVDDYLKAAHEANLTPAQVKNNLAWYFAKQEQQIEERARLDAEALTKGEETLREVWGSEAKLNKGLINGLIATAPEGVADLLLGARLGDGTPLGSHPNTLRWLADLARKVNPVATVVPGSGENAAAAIESELAGLEKKMGDKNSDYWKGPLADKNQSRYRDLVSAKQRMG